MKRFNLILAVILVVMCSFTGFVYAENEAVVEESTSVINFDGKGAIDTALNILDAATKWALPICAICLVIGAVQYFIVGIRNLYKKKQGLILMFSTMTFYVVIVVLNFVLTFIAAQDFSEVINLEQAANIEVGATAIDAGNTAMNTALEVLNFATMWALPFCTILAVFGAVQYFIMGIRNLYKKRQGLLLMFGSIAFYVIILVINYVLKLAVG